MHSLKENILNQLLINPNFDLLMQNDFFSNLINNVFDKSQFKFIPPVKMNINANKITIYNGLVIPKSKSFLDLIIKYINDELSVRYLKIEESLRKKITKQEKIDEEIKNYNKQMETFEKNIKKEINKYDFFKQIFNQNNEELKKMITNEYIKYFIIKYIKKKEMNDFEVNEKLIGFLQLIIKIKLSDSHNHHYDFENTIELGKIFIKLLYKRNVKMLTDNIMKAINDLYKFLLYQLIILSNIFFIKGIYNNKIDTIKTNILENKYPYHFKFIKLILPLNIKTIIIPYKNSAIKVIIITHKKATMLSMILFLYSNEIPKNIAKCIK